MPGTTGTPACTAAARAAVLLPIAAIASGLGPMKVSPDGRFIRLTDPDLTDFPFIYLFFIHSGYYIKYLFK